MPRKRKTKLKSFVIDSDKGLHEIKIIDDEVEVINTRKPRTSRPKGKKSSKQTRTAQQDKQNDIEQNKIEKTGTGKRKRSFSEIEDVQTSNSNKSKSNPSKSKIWNNFFLNRNESRKLRQLIEKYNRSNVIEMNGTRAKKRRISKSVAKKRIDTDQNKSYLDMIRERSNFSMTRSMVKKAMEEAKINNEFIEEEKLIPDQSGNDDSNDNSNDDDIIEMESEHDKMLGWVSATRTKHYILNDTCMDWLDRYYSQYGLTDNPVSEGERQEYEQYIKNTSHLELLFDGGNRFEDEVYKELKDIYEDEFTLIFTEEDYQVFRKDRDMNGFIRNKYEDTLVAMREGVPIIAQAVMINDSNMTYGIADLLVRSDYLAEMFSYFPEDADIEYGAEKIGADNYHYRVIDCKWTTMTLCVNGLHIRNEGFFPAYKGQLAVYNSCLRQMQGYVPDKAYIMAKAWKIGAQNVPVGEESQYRGFSAFDRLGVIDYANWDRKYVQETKEAIRWVQRVMTEGREWRYGPDAPSVPELYPNMNKTYDAAFTDVKAKIAERYGEITQGWYLSPSNRYRAREAGITDIRDPRLTLDILEVTSKKRGPVIREIININKRDQVKDLVRPPIIRVNNTNWQSPHIMDYYVDFETINYNLFVKPDYIDLDNSYFDSGVTFMIGVGFVHEPDVDTSKLLDALEIDGERCGVYHRIDEKNYGGHGHWEFVCFYLTSFHVENELELFRLFFQFTIVRNCIIKEIYGIDDDSSKSDGRIFHWTSAELTFMRNAVRRMKSDQYDRVLADIFHLESDEDVKVAKKDVKDLIRCFEDTVIWVDLYDEMLREPVVVKGCYRFKLKHFANAMQKHGLIMTNWGSTKMSDGLRAMFEAIIIYRDCDDRDLLVSADTNQDFKEIIDYNEVDCRVMWEIIEYLRANHTAGAAEEYGG